MLLASTIESDPIVKALRARIGESKTPLAATGLWGSSAPILAALLAHQSKRPVLYITAHLDQADDARDDMETALERAVEVLPAWETLPGEGSGAGEIGAERARLCALLRPAGAPAATLGSSATICVSSAPETGAATIIVAPIQALIQPVPTPESLDAHTLVLSVGQHCEPDTIATFLVERGFDRLDQVEDPGDFAQRGGILDIFASTERDPVRIEFFGDRIESIRQFEVGTQRSVRTMTTTRITLPPSQAKLQSADTTTIFNYLDPQTLIVLSEPTEIAEIGRTILERLGNPVGHFPVETILRKAGTFSHLHLSRFPTGAAADDDTYALSCESLPTFEAKATDAVAQLLAMARQDRALIYCDNQGEAERLQELIDQAATVDPTARREIATQIGLIHQGFRWVSGADGQRHALVVVAHHELFRRYTQKRRLRKVAATRPIESFLDLAEGDFVVHIAHGIGQYVGMRTMRRGDSRTSEEFLTIRFADDATMHVPASQIDLVQKYIGAKTARPPLSKLGGKRWEKTKEKVEEAVGDMAADLLRIQAVRESQPGVAYPQDTHWQTEFENAFLYTETPDQVMTLRDIKTDMARPRPMDRLLCGDVGYGKTELAMRAAFKVIEFGKQAAVLVPTTVLAEQHFRTFKERMADYPFVVECLNRFRSAREQKAIIAAARAGRVDILIGTHRLLSKDVGFADLGLVVIDEEQRFGVEHKERLKQLRTTVDVLTLTATPIPRTLHMSMIGLRDISSLATPPLDRRSISTSVCAWSDTLIREAIVREMNRDGQVYFVHNRVRTIEQIANKVRSLVPEAKLLIGHGQMHGDELEEVMARFVRREADVLVCTSIIESGLDIPSANTMFIDRAELFGLADLHQLRGRVGRYKHRAYCYLLLSPNRPLTSMAAKRLKAIEEYSDLGAGFRIAMRDLEIRGAGNILGAEQSGNIAAVGYELYCQLLEKAVKRMRGDVAAPRAAVHLELDVEAQIPKSYIPSDRQRMECYRRFAACRTPEDVEELAHDLEDAFGRYPESVETLLTVTEIKVRAMAWNIKTIIKREPDVIFSIEGEIKKVEPLFAGSAGSIRIPDGRTLHWRVPENYFHGTSLLPILVNLFRRAAGSPTAGRTEPVGGRRVTNPAKKGAITASGTSGGGVQ